MLTFLIDHCLFFFSHNPGPGFQVELETRFAAQSQCLVTASLSRCLSLSSKFRLKLHLETRHRCIVRLQCTSFVYNIHPGGTEAPDIIPQWERVTQEQQYCLFIMTHDEDGWGETGQVSFDLSHYKQDRFHSISLIINRTGFIRSLSL